MLRALTFPRRLGGKGEPTRTPTPYSGVFGAENEQVPPHGGVECARERGRKTACIVCRP